MALALTMVQTLAPARIPSDSEKPESMCLWNRAASVRSMRVVRSCGTRLEDGADEQPRGIPLVPTDKLAIDAEGKTNILLLRTGEKKQGVIGLFQPGVPGEVSPSLSVRFMGISRKAIASYLISLYCSAVLLTDDALAVLEDVYVGNYDDR